MKKELIRIYVLIGPESNGVQTHVKKVNKKNIYYGFGWDILKAIEIIPEINKKYKFEYKFSKYGYSNYDNAVGKVAQGKYDLCLGIFTHNTKREKIINYTKDIIIIPNAVFYIHKKTFLDIIKNIYLKIYHLLQIFVIFCIIFTIIVTYILKKHKLKKNLFYIIASFFGEHGALVDKFSINFKMICISTIIFLISFITLAYFEGQILKLILEESNNKTINNFKKKPVLAHKGYATAKQLAEQGANVEFLENKNNKDLFDIYIKNMEKYSGITITYCDGYAFLDGSEYQDEVDGLQAAINFGVDPCGFIVNQKKIEFLEDINSAITTLRETKELNRICKSYFGKIKDYNVCKF